MPTLIQNKATNYCIAIPENASIVEKKAAEELSLYIQKSCDVLLPICDENSVNGNAIYVGHTNYAIKNGLKGNSVENWLIAVCEENVVLTGGLTNKNRGIPYAVYHFLEDVVGIRWWSWFEEYIPKLQELTIPKDFKKSGTPVFEYRNIYDVPENIDLSYVIHNRLNAWCTKEKPYHPEFMSRGGIEYSGLPSDSHSMPNLVPIDEHYDEHPEWFAYHELSKTRMRTTQRGTLYCLTNPGLIEYTAKKIIENIDENLQIAEKEGLGLPCYFDLSMADAGGLCQCENCKKTFEKGGKTGYNLSFINAVAEIVAEKHPDIFIETLVYWDYIEPPKDDTVPAKNVLIRLADLKIDLLRDIESPTNKEEKRLLETWGTLCKKNNTKLYIWDYYLQQYPNCMMPYFLKMPKNFRYFYENQVRGCFIEHETSHISDFWTMTQWLLTRVMEDPYQDFDSLIDDFVTRYYGDAAPYISQYIELLKKNLSENACRIMVFEQAHISNYVSYSTIREGIKILLRAESSVKGDALRLARVHTVMSCLYRTFVLRYEEFMQIAKQNGETLPMAKQEAGELVISYLKESAHIYTDAPDGRKVNARVTDAIERQINHMKQYLARKKQTVKVPDELIQFGEENVYCIPGSAFYGLAGCGMLPEGHQNGESVEFTDEFGHEILKILPQEIPGRRKYTYLSGSNKDEVLNPLIFFTEGTHENVKLELFHEDLYQEQFHLYHIGKVSNVSEHSSTMFRLFDFLGYCFGISNLYEIFPADAYSIYVNLKVSGPGFGGDADKEDTLYLGGVYIVKHRSGNSK